MQHEKIVYQHLQGQFRADTGQPMARKPPQAASSVPSGTCAMARSRAKGTAVPITAAVCCRRFQPRGNPPASEMEDDPPRHDVLQYVAIAQEVMGRVQAHMTEVSAQTS